jgi:hypothetical protein
MSAGLAGLSAVWLGVLSAVSPCPLAANVAALVFIGRRAGDPRAAPAKPSRC